MPTREEFEADALEVTTKIQGFMNPLLEAMSKKFGFKVMVSVNIECKGAIFENDPDLRECAHCGRKYSVFNAVHPICPGCGMMG